jgi:hypothetical protein
MLKNFFLIFKNKRFKIKMSINIFKSFFLLYLTSFVVSQDCLLKVPKDPLNNGLFQPWFLSTNPISTLPCSQTIPGSEVFVEATIFDYKNNKFFVYNPLVIDAGTTPALPPLIAPLPEYSIVVIHIGANGKTVTLTDTYNSLLLGNCVNGIIGSVFGQFAYCNAFNFFNKVNKNIANGYLIIPPIGNTLLGDICPTTRSFTIVDQDQSDNVITQYLLTTNCQVAQDTNQNRATLNVKTILKNGSDNRLVAEFIDVAVGCVPFMAPDLVDTCCTMRPSMALNEIQANLLSLTAITTALIPSIDPMTLHNGIECLEKVNLYRIGVNQPPLISLNRQNNINYCLQMANAIVPFYILHQTNLQLQPSPDNTANNLLNFLANRFVNSWTNLNAQNLTGNPSPITVVIENNMVISNNLNTIQTTTLPPTLTTTLTPTLTTTLTPTLTTTLTPTTTPLQYINLCGNSFNNVNCSEPCPNGLNNECKTNNFTCFSVPNQMTICNVFNFCGNVFNNLSCTESCPLGSNSECKTPEFFCFKDVQKTCTSYDINGTITDSNITMSNSRNNGSTKQTNNSFPLGLNIFLTILILCFNVFYIYL